MSMIGLKLNADSSSWRKCLIGADGCGAVLRTVFIRRGVFIVVFIMTVLTTACLKSNSTSTEFVTPDIHSLQLRTFETIWETVNDNYLYDDFQGIDWESAKDFHLNRLDEEVTPDEFTFIAEEMLAQLPSGSARLITREERIDRAITDLSTFEGIGAFVAVRDDPERRVLILSVMPGSPAQAAGIKAHDSIIAINETPISEIEPGEEIAHIRGPAGSDVALTVQSPDMEPRDILVTRGSVDRTQDRIYWELLANSNVAYFRFPPLTYEGIELDFVQGYQAMTTEGNLEAAILDLRVVNGAGNWPASGMLTVFSDGEVGEFFSRHNASPADVEGIDELENSQNLPLAILVGPDTTGAAEIFAAALQANERAIIVGAATPGEVESETSFNLPDGSRLFLTTSSFRTPDGRDVGLSGVTPDVPVEVDWDELTAEDDAVREAALRALESGSG
jgi:carboxyl-terminal processing protease